jgi:prepilin-type N-terminal cleavage/methylation domain-containing protein/prepilin-type processing-associated H-X9-DG protein
MQIQSKHPEDRASHFECVREKTMKLKPLKAFRFGKACRHSGSAGFTLSELLVALLIIAVLAVITISITVRVLSSARQAGGVAVMRQVGIATAAFIADNNDRIPGPIAANGQLPNYSVKSSRTLFSQLIPYIGLEEKSRITGLPDSLVCPAFRHRFPGWNANGQGNLGGNLGTPGGNGRVYYMNQDLMLKGKRVFGPQTDQQAADQPDTMRYSAVSDGAPATPIGKIVMLTDFEERIHGNTRNYLFMDFHVESLPGSHPVEAWPK